MKKKAVLGLFFTVCAFFLLLIPGERISNAIGEAIIFCGKSIIPQLFLSICISQVVWELGIIERFIIAYPKWGAEISAFVMGLLAGFPTGAIICGKLVSDGYITEKRGEYITTFSNNAGISFVFGYVSRIIGKEGAISVFICQITVSLFLAIVFRVTLDDEDKKGVYFVPRNVSPLCLVKAITGATNSILNICGFILFFSALTNGILCGMPLILRGLAELTTGVTQTVLLPFDLRLVYCGMFIGFCGVCVQFQIASACQVKITKYMLSRCVSAVLYAVLIIPVHRVVMNL